MEYWDRKLSGLVDELKNEVELLGGGTMGVQELKTRLNDCENKVEEIRRGKQNYLTEVRMLEDHLEQQHYKTKLNHLDEQTQAAQERMAQARREVERRQLLEGAEARAQRNPNARAGNDQLLDQAEQKLGEIKESYQRDEILLEEIKVVGGDAVTKLRGQREQINEITEKADEIESQLKRADILVRNFARRMATDRVIQVFALINGLILLGIVIYVIVTGANLTEGVKNPDNVPDASSARLRHLSSLNAADQGHLRASTQ